MKKYKKKVVEYLISEVLLQSYHTYLGEACYTNGLEKIEDEYVKLDNEPKYIHLKSLVIELLKIVLIMFKILLCPICSENDEDKTRKC